MDEKSKNFLLTAVGIGSILVCLLIATFLLKGSASLGAAMHPWLTLIVRYVFWSFVLILLPLSLFRKTRSFSGSCIYAASFIFGAYLWITSFLITYAVWGLSAVIIGLLMAGIGVIPIAMIAAIISDDWSACWHLILLLILTVGSRILGIRLRESPAQLPSDTAFVDKADNEAQQVQTFGQDKMVLPAEPKAHRMREAPAQLPSETVFVDKTDNEAQQVQTSGQDKMILLAEDEASLCKLIEMELTEECNVVVEGVATVASAIEALKQNKNKIGVVISCLNFPDADGRLLLRVCKEIAPNIPFIIFSALDLRNDDGVRAADAYIVKSSDMTELKETVTKLLKTQGPSGQPDSH